IVFGVSEDCLVVPAHIWTPWFSVFGSMSGFDSLEECFEELAPKIHAIETGLSSDPPMNWRVSGLDRLTLISNSDSHSPAKIGREANVFELEKLNYQNIAAALKKSSPKNKLAKTIEFFPEEGKYHFDGHANCGVNFSPAESKKHKQLCPKCGKPLVIGVLNRVEVLADREAGEKPAGAADFKSLIPLEEIIAETLGVGVSLKKVRKIYFDLIEKFGNEFEILLNSPIEKIAEASQSPIIAEGVKRVREGKIKITPGFDGVYGKIEIFSEKERRLGKSF
ncbi:MAG: endonuclease Q family protein, partial [Patescibacteria group bacterium]